MQEKRCCPGCQARMQVMQTGQVELDRCDFCGGVWFDGEELEQVLGHPIVVERTGASRRPCAYCGSLMLLGRIKQVEVDTCASCRGIYLDDGELERCAGLGRVGAEVAPVAAAPGAVELADAPRGAEPAPPARFAPPPQGSPTDFGGGGGTSCAVETVVGVGYAVKGAAGLLALLFDVLE